MANPNDRARVANDQPSERVPVDPRHSVSTTTPRANESEPDAQKGLGSSDALDQDDIGDIADEGRGHRG